MSPVRLAIVGLGKIARDQHVPAVAETPGIELVAIASRNASLDGIAHYATLDELLVRAPEIDAVALCTPPQPRRNQAMAALAAGKHVLLEKPPGATVSEIAPLLACAREKGCTLFATWHSRFAPAVAPARAFLARHRPLSVTVTWKEDARLWHPGQDWIFEPGGLGVFDPGINALSILTAILPGAFRVEAATLVYPENRQTPVAAEVRLRGATGYPVAVELDWLQEGPQTWDIVVETDAGRLTLAQGGAVAAIDGAELAHEPEAEYPRLYRRFAELIRARASDVDASPLRIVADAFLIGRREIGPPFLD